MTEQIHGVQTEEEQPSENVTIRFGEVVKKVEVDDVNPEDLKDLFDLDFEVKRLVEDETQKTILMKKKEGKIKPGYTYVIQPQLAKPSSR